MIQKKHIKKITTFLLLLVTILTLVACGKKENVPYGEISDDAYLTLGDIEITNKDVYDNLRRQSGSTLPKMIEEKLFEGYVTKAKNLLSGDSDESQWAKEEFDNEVNQAIFSTKDVERIAKFKNFEIEIAIQKYVDGLYVQNSKINREKIKSVLVDLLVVENKDDEDFATGYYENEDLEILKDFYTLKIAKKVYAEEILNEEVKDEDNDNFIKDKDIIRHYKNEVKGRHDSNVFFFNFYSLNEANAAFRKLSIKSNSRGHWFNVPDVRFADALDNLDNKLSSYVQETLDEINLTEKFETHKDEDENGRIPTMISDVDYKKFYEAYSLSESRDEKLPNYVVLNNFIKLYNLLNDDKLAELDENITDEDLNGLEIKFANGNKYETEHDYDSLGKVGSSLRNYVYDTLTEEKPYSTLRSVGSFRYLIFKLDENYNELNFISEEKDEDDNEKLVTVEEIVELLEDEDKGKDLFDALSELDLVDGDKVNEEKLESYLKENIKEWTEEVRKSKLTSSYVNSKVNKVLEDAKVEIFDNVVRTFYNQSAKSEAKGKGKSGNILLTYEVELNDEKVKFEITVDELYEKLENQIGLETAIDLVVNKFLLAEFNKKDGMFKDEDINVKDYKKELKDLINNFSNNGFAEAGYPASIGRESFLLMLFGSTDLDEAVELGYIVPELRDLFVKDYDNHLQVNDKFDDVYDVLSKYAEKLHNNFKGLNVSHLLVYFDTDGDDSPNNPHEYFETLDNDQVIELKKLIIELYYRIIFEVGEDGLSEAKLKAVVEEYQSYARLPLGDYKPEKWEKFRRAGINLKFENIGSEITNTSNFPTGNSVLDKVFYDRAILLHDHIMEDRNKDDEKLVDDGLPFLDYATSNLNIVEDTGLLYNDDEDFTNLDELISDFGVHFIMVNKISEKSSAEYKESDDHNEDYAVEIDGEKYNVYNDSETISKDQIEYYIKGNKLEEGVLLPSKVKQAFSKYFDPVFELYNGNIMRVELLNNLLENEGINWLGKEDRINAIREINRNQFHQYLLGNNENYDELYADWFEDFGLVK